MGMLSIASVRRSRMLLLGIAALVGSIPARGVDETLRRATLEAIHQLENPRELLRPGPFGELGAYQFRRSTWEMHTTVPFGAAIERATSDRVAVCHYEWLKRELEKAGRPATAYNIALAWNGGLRAAITGRSPRAARDYAQRAANLADDFVRNQAGLVVSTR